MTHVPVQLKGQNKKCKKSEQSQQQLHWFEKFRQRQQTVSAVL